MKFTGKLALVLLWGGNAAVAQMQFRTISARAGTINYQQGSVYVDDKRAHSTSGAPPFQMKNGQRLHVDSGRVELLLGSGVYLRMLGASSIRMQETQLADTRVLVETGSAIIEVAGMNKGAQLRILCGDSTTELKRDGLYRFDAPCESTAGQSTPGQSITGQPATGPVPGDAKAGRLRIYSGDAAVDRAGIAVKASRGQAVDLAGGLEPAKFDLKQMDALYSWSAQRTKRRIDNEQRRMQSRLMQAARSKMELDQPGEGSLSKKTQDQNSKGPQP